MKNCLIAAAILLTATAKAQHARVQAGVNLANISVTDNGRVDDANMLWQGLPRLPVHNSQDVDAPQREGTLSVYPIFHLWNDYGNCDSL